MTDEEDQQGVSVFVETAEKFKRKLQRYGPLQTSNIHCFFIENNNVFIVR